MTEANISEEYWTFVNDVAHGASVHHEQAEELTRATLRELGRSISAGEAARLADWLPAELRGELTADSGQARRIDKRTFVDAVGRASPSTDVATVEKQVRAVFRAVRSEVHDGHELSDTLAQLPSGLVEMFD